VTRSHQPSTPSASTAAIQPTQDYFTTVFEAREIIIGDCMAELDHDYRPRPNDAAGTGGSWDEWNQWHTARVAADPTFEAAFQSDPNDQIGGCQAEAYPAVHGPGEEAYSKAAMLENEPTSTGSTSTRPPSTNGSPTTEDIERLRAELDEEQQTARSIIENANN
jgi:hypothetical protein